MSLATSNLERKQELLQEMNELLEHRKILKARSSLKDFCEYVIKDEKTGGKIVLAEIQHSWVNHIGFCKNHGINALILAPMASGKCVAPETLFFTPIGWKPANTLEEGDVIASFDTDTREHTWTKVVYVEPQLPKEMYQVQLDSGKKLTCTFDHQLLCVGVEDSLEWVQACDLTANDRVIVPADWCFDGGATDYYGFGLTSLTNKPSRYDLGRLLEYVKLFDLDLDRAELEKSGTVRIQDLGYNITSLSRHGLSTYLAGVLDAVGNYNASLKMYEIQHTSKEKLFELQIAFQSLGVKSRIVRRIRPKGVSFSLMIPREYTGNVQEKFPCTLTKAREHLPCKRSEDVKFFAESISSVINLGKDVSIGIETENHVHITNGMVSHNTQIVGVALPLYLIGKDPSCRIKMVCLSDDAAKERLGSIQSYITEDEDYHRVFPNIKKDKDKEWSKHNITVERETRSAKDPSVSAKGVISNGIGGRCDILLVDDIFDQRTAITQPATRDQINATYRIVWLSRIDKGGMAVVICTRWHERDLAGEVLNDPAMRDQYGILIQSINADFTGIDIRVIVPDRLKEAYEKSMGGFSEV